jgi:hypothetical protein
MEKRINFHHLWGSSLHGWLTIAFLQYEETPFLLLLDGQFSSIRKLINLWLIDPLKLERKLVSFVTITY